MEWFWWFGGKQPRHSSVTGLNALDWESLKDDDLSENFLRITGSRPYVCIQLQPHHNHLLVQISLSDIFVTCTSGICHKFVRCQKLISALRTYILILYTHNHQTHKNHCISKPFLHSQIFSNCKIQYYHLNSLILAESSKSVILEQRVLVVR